MTANKGFKKLVRQRMQQTGLSYAAARHLLRAPQHEEPIVATREELNESMATMQAVVREYLRPVAELRKKQLDPDVVSAVVFDREASVGQAEEHWVVHVYSLSPGVVLGERGQTAAALRAELCRVSRDADLQLNIIDFAEIHASRRRPA